MSKDELNSLRQQLEQCYSLQPETQTRSLDLWNGRLQAVWQSFTKYMIYQPQLQAITDQRISPPDYTQKLRFYPYLPPIEEERDWLEKSYYDSGNS